MSGSMRLPYTGGHEVRGNFRDCCACDCGYLLPVFRIPVVDQLSLVAMIF